MKWDELSDEVRLNIIQREYISNCRSFIDIAKEYNTYTKKLTRFAAKNGIKARDPSEAQKLALESGRTQHPTEGKERTFEEREKMSKTQLENWNSLSKEEQDKIKKEAGDRFREMSFEDKQKAKQAAKEGMVRASQMGSKLEQFLRENLLRLGYVVEFHRSNLVAFRANLEVDLFIPTHSICIEVDGITHWKSVFGEGVRSKTVVADYKKTGDLTYSGYYVIRLICKEKIESFNQMNNLLQKLLWAIKEVESGRVDKTKYLFVDVS